MFDVMFRSDIRGVLPAVRVPTLVTHRRGNRYLEPIEEFLLGRQRPARIDRKLATVLFTDIVGSSTKASELGDRWWGELLAAHHDLVRGELASFGGREVDTAGDGFFATFDGPARAVQCATAIVQAVRRLGLEVRSGVHTGEVEVVDGKPGGIAVVIGARVAALGSPRAVLVSSTVKDLVAGSGLRFHDAGVRSLKGVPGEWHLYAVDPSTGSG